MSALGALGAVDRVITLDARRGVATGIKNVPATLTIFDEHFERFPVLPGVLVLDGLSRLGTALLNEVTGESWFLRETVDARFRRYVQPGDQVELAVTVKDRQLDRAVLEATARVGAARVVTVRQLVMLREGVTCPGS